MPTELGKLVTGQDYGGDAKKCMDAVAKSSTPKPRTRVCSRMLQPRVSGGGACLLRFILNTVNVTRSGYRNRLLHLGDQGDRLGPRGHSVAEGRMAIGLANPQPGLFRTESRRMVEFDRGRLAQMPGEVDPGRIAAVGDLQSTRNLRLFTEDGTASAPGMTWLDERARAQLIALANYLAPNAFTPFPANRSTSCPVFIASSGRRDRAGYLRPRGERLPRCTAI